MTQREDQRWLTGGPGAVGRRVGLGRAWRCVLVGIGANAVVGVTGLRAATVIVPDDDPSLVRAAANVAPGDVIQVRDGVYTVGEAIVIRAAGVQLVGLGGRPVITGASGRGGLRVRATDSVSITGIEIRGKDTAVRLDDCTGCAVFDVVFTECGAGVRVRRGSGNYVWGNVFDPVRRKDGVLFEYSPFGIVAGNRISIVRSGGSWSQKGVSIRGSEGVQVFDNDVQGGSRGIWIRDGSAGSVVSRNTASANRGDGFRVDSDDVRMSENDAFGNGHWGFRVDNSDRVVLEDNTASTNEDGGFYVKGDGALVSGNTASANGAGNGGDGFYLRGAEAVLSGNVAANNRDDGFDIAGAALDIQQNSATDNGGYGFDVSSSSPDLTQADLLAAGNTASGNLIDFRVD